MTSPDELERLRAAFAAGAQDALPGESCPDPERLFSARRLELPPDAIRSLVAHTAACGACAEAWRLAGELDVLMPRPAAVPPPSRSRPWWGGWTSSLAAAAVLVIALGGLLGERRGPAYREGAGLVLRSLVPEGRPLPRQACVLRWSPGPPGSRYAVDVARDDLVPIAAARGLERAEYRVPPESLVGLPRGATLLWRVDAVLAGGGRLESVTFLAKLE